MVRLNPRTQCMSDNENAERLKTEIKGYLDSIAKCDENDIIYLDLNYEYYSDDYTVDFIKNDIGNALNNIGKVTKIIITCIDDNYGKNSAKIAEAFFACGFVPINNFNKANGYKMIYVNDEALPVISANISLWFVEKEVKIKQDKEAFEAASRGLEFMRNMQQPK